MAADLTPTLLRTLLHYEPDTGKLLWKSRPLDMFASERHGKIWNTRFAGKEALSGITDDRGYKGGRVLSRNVYAHRAAFAVYYGRWPVGLIDHKDGDRGNNRLENLREATKSQNAMNAGAWPGASDFRGVSIRSRDKRWVATINKDGKQTWLGSYSCEVEAAKAYDNAAKEAFEPYAKLNFPEGV